VLDVRVRFISQVKAATTLTAAQAAIIGEVDCYNVAKRFEKAGLGKAWFKTPAAAWLVLAITDGAALSYEDFVARTAKPLGLNLKPLEAIRLKYQPAPAAKAVQTSAHVTKKPAANKKKGGR